MPERLECEVLQKARYINTLTLTLPLTPPVGYNMTWKGNSYQIVQI